MPPRWNHLPRLRSDPGMDPLDLAPCSPCCARRLPAFWGEPPVLHAW